MEQTIYDVFISYRRDGGSETAGRINDLLSYDGFMVSYDIDTLREGPFNEQLFKRIEQCVDFILIVDKNCFARTLEKIDRKNDWLRQELAHALLLKKNVIPVLLPGASFPENLPEDIDNVRYCNGPTHNNEYFDAFYNKLKGFMHALPRKTATLEASSRNASSHSSKLPCLKLKTDLDCIFYLDGEETARLKAGIIQKFPLKKGEYELRFVSEENENDFLEMDEFKMPEDDKLLKVSLREVCEKRMNKEKSVLMISQEKQSSEARRPEGVGMVPNAEVKKEDECAKILAFTVKGVSFKMVHVEGGTFTMGSAIETGSSSLEKVIPAAVSMSTPILLGVEKLYQAFSSTSKQDSEEHVNEKPAHQVTLSSYYLGDTEVTQELWEAVMGSNPSYFTGFKLPVEKVSWDDCQSFIRKLNAMTGRTFRLPTEAEWEYAARGGIRSMGYKYAGSDDLDTVAWHDVNSGSNTHRVATKAPNELGIYDMSGNVNEWCHDWYDRYSFISLTNPQGPKSGNVRVCRGGGWNYKAECCRSFYRNCFDPSRRYYNLGLRLALTE